MTICFLKLEDLSTDLASLTSNDFADHAGYFFIALFLVHINFWFFSKMVFVLK